MNFNTYIKSPKQLHNTYITNDCPVKRYVYVALCHKFGIKTPSRIEKDYLEIASFERSEFTLYQSETKDSLDHMSKELHLADLVDLHDSYVMTSDFGTAKQFGDLVGDAISGAEFLKFNVVTCGDSNALEFYYVSESNLASIVQNKTELTTGLIYAMYDEMVKIKALNDSYAAELKDTKPVSLTDFLKRTNTMYSEENVTSSTKMKVEHALAKESPAEIYRAMLDGEKFYCCKTDLMEFDGYQFWIHTDQGKSRVTYINQDHEIYRRIEKPVDWREELISFLISPSKDTSPKLEEIGINTSIGSMRENDFLEMCRVALRATGELPDTTK